MTIAAVTKWYCNFGDGSTTGYYAVSQWGNGASKTVGNLVRQLATPATGSERIWVCGVAGTTGGSEPAWSLTKNARTTDNTVQWFECTGHPAVNGDYTNTSPWVASSATSLGIIIKNTAATRLFICTTSSGNTSVAEPTWNTSTGSTTNDGSNVWTCIGASFTNWTAPHARLVTVIGNSYANTAGQTVYVSDTHAETQASAMNLRALNGTVISPITVVCVNHSGNVPPGSGDVTTGATVSTTGANDLTIGIAGANSTCGDYYGIEFKAGSAANSANLSFLGGAGNNGLARLTNCKLTLNNTNSGSLMIIGAGNAVTLMPVVEWIGCQCKFGATGQSIQFSANVGNFIWRDGSLGYAKAIDNGGSLPTTLFTSNNSENIPLKDIHGLDLSDLTGTIFGALSSSDPTFSRNNKINASATISATPTKTRQRVYSVLVDSGAHAYNQQIDAYEGKLTAETTIVNTSNGASDGTTPISWKIATTANIGRWTAPFECFPISIWNTVVGSSVTATVEIINDGTTLTNADIWMDIEYLGTSSAPVTSVATTAMANPLATATNVTTSSSNWVTTGLGSPVTQKLTVSFTPQFAGYVRADIKIGRASKTIYVNPLVTLS